MELRPLCPSKKEWEEIQRTLVPAYTDHELAQIALEFVNDKEDVKLELDAPLGSCKQLRVMPTQQWCHVYAKKPVTADSTDTSLKLIFVELVNVMKAKFSLSVYSIMDLETPDIRDGCMFCPADGKHPHPPEEIHMAGCNPPPWSSPTDPKFSPFDKVR